MLSNGLVIELHDPIAHHDGPHDVRRAILCGHQHAALQQSLEQIQFLPLFPFVVSTNQTAQHRAAANHVARHLRLRAPRGSLELHFEPRQNGAKRGDRQEHREEHRLFLAEPAGFHESFHDGLHGGVEFPAEHPDLDEKGEEMGALGSRQAVLEQQRAQRGGQNPVQPRGGHCPVEKEEREAGDGGGEEGEGLVREEKTHTAALQRGEELRDGIDLLQSHPF